MQWSWPSARHHRFGTPTLGQHNAEILGDELGLTGEQLTKLTSDRVIGDWPQT
jgi:hypothetical protein